MIGLGDQRAEDHAHNAEKDGADKSPPEAGDKKTWHEIRGQLEHEGVDDEPK